MVAGNKHKVFGKQINGGKIGISIEISIFFHKEKKFNYNNNGSIMEKNIEVENVGYIRVSTKEQAKEGYSLDFQWRKIEEYYRDLGIENYTILVDDGYSATNEERPKYKILKEYIELKAIKKIVVYKMDRVHRNVSNCNNFVNECLKNNVSLHSINERLDYHTAMGRAFTNISASISQLESELISERTLNGFIGKASLGQYPYKSTIFGYDKINNYLKVNPKQAEVIKYIFKNYDKKTYKVLRYIEKNYGYKLTYYKYKKIISNYNFYIDGKMCIEGQKYKLAEPILNNKFIIKNYNKFQKEQEVNLIKGNSCNSVMEEYKYYNKVYYNDVLLKHSCGYGKNGRKYYYYIDKKSGFKISEKYIDQLLNNNNLMNDIKIKEKYEMLFELYVDNRIDDVQLLGRLCNLKRKSNIEKIILKSYQDYEIRYK